MLYTENNNDGFLIVEDTLLQSMVYSLILRNLLYPKSSRIGADI